MPDLTVAICAYNAAGRLGRVMDALAAQEVDGGVTWEIIVVDNRSTDGTAEVARSYAGRVPLRVVREERQGLTYARQRAVAEAHGETLSFIDDDNVVETDWVHECIRFFSETPLAGLAGGFVYPIFEDPNSKPPDFDVEYATALACRDLGSVERPMAGLEEPPCGAGMTVRTQVLRDVLRANTLVLSDRKGTSLASGGDTEIGLLVRKAGWQTWYVPTMRLGHLLPPRRLTPLYLARLRVGFAASSIWLDVLRGKRGEYSLGEIDHELKRYAFRRCKLRLLRWLGPMLGRDPNRDQLAVEDADARFAIFSELRERASLRRDRKAPTVVDASIEAT